jgi:hypothetical protein
LTAHLLLWHRCGGLERSGPVVQLLSCSTSTVESTLLDKNERCPFHFAYRYRPRKIWIIVYRCTDYRFPMSPQAMAFLNQDCLSSSETRVNAGIRSWKLHLSESSWCQE